MTRRTTNVDLYDSHYGNFTSDLYANIRKKTYDSDIGQNGWLTAAEQDLFIKWLGMNPDDRLLDIACGSGGPTLRIAALTGCRVDGVDMHADGIARAVTAAAERGLDKQAAFHHVDASQELPFDDASFDGLMCIDAVNHLPDRPAVFADWHRVLKLGGRLVFTDPIVVTGPLTHEEIAVRSSIGFFVFVPDGINSALLQEAGFVLEHREDRTSNMAEMAARWRDARAVRGEELRKIEGDATFVGQQEFFNVCSRLAREKRLSRHAFCAVKM